VTAAHAAHPPAHDQGPDLLDLDVEQAFDRVADLDLVGGALDLEQVLVLLLAQAVAFLGQDQRGS
jgi:hypothetical protein